MKQVVQNLRSGVLELLDVPSPAPRSGHLLIRSQSSLISAGTERFLVEFGRANLLSKARQNPDRVKQVLDKIRSDGLLPTLEAVFSRLDEPLPLGYCNAGVVDEVGEHVQGFVAGDRVASNGPHAEWINVPTNLCAKIPDGVSDDHAAFAVLGAIALQGIRLLQPTLGENVAVFGLGLVGQMSVQILAASGVRVLGIDLDPRRLALATSFGAEVVDLSAGADVERSAESFSHGHGLDGVLVTASAKNDDIVNQAARMSRKRGRIIMVGVTDLHLERPAFYEKELTFQVSCSYGPGRYDPSYEQGGMDYPLPYVRWTEQRNIAAVLQLIAQGKLDVEPLITSRHEHRHAARAYDALAGDATQMAIVLTYPQQRPSRAHTLASPAGLTQQIMAPQNGQVVVGMIGAGMFSKAVLLPALKQSGAQLKTIASAGGLSAAHASRKFGFDQSTTRYQNVLCDPDINLVFITTRHHQHADMVCEALQAGKHVFVEKPLALREADLTRIQQTHAEAGRHLMVGFNRRFSPHATQIKKLIGGRGQPLCMVMTVNAGYIPREHWAHDPLVGGGRLVGEGCHWIDLFRYLIDAPIVDVSAKSVGPETGVTRHDHVSVTLVFQDGSLATLHYFANGHRSFPKEHLQVFCEGKVLELDNFRTLRGFGFSQFKKNRLLRQDKGHQTEIAEFIRRVGSGGPALIPLQELLEVTRWTIRADALSRNEVTQYADLSDE